jgi:hypothetical protein
MILVSLQKMVHDDKKTTNAECLPGTVLRNVFDLRCPCIKNSNVERTQVPVRAGAVGDFKSDQFVTSWNRQQVLLKIIEGI